MAPNQGAANDVRETLQGLGSPPGQSPQEGAQGPPKTKLAAPARTSISKRTTHSAFLQLCKPRCSAQHLTCRFPCSLNTSVLCLLCPHHVRQLWPPPCHQQAQWGAL